MGTARHSGLFNGLKREACATVYGSGTMRGFCFVLHWLFSVCVLWVHHTCQIELGHQKATKGKRDPHV